jgi:hypothetical protein
MPSTLHRGLAYPCRLAPIDQHERVDGHVYVTIRLALVGDSNSHPVVSTTTYQGYRDQDIPRHLIDWEFAGKVRHFRPHSLCVAKGLPSDRFAIR